MSLQIETLYTTNPLDNESTTLQTLTTMRQVVNSCYQSPFITRCVDKAIRDCNESASDKDIIRACYYYLKNHVKFCEDEEITLYGLRRKLHRLGTELLIHPEALLGGMGHGDCDDFSMSLAAMLKNLGVPVRFCAVAADESDPSRWTHVYVMGYTPKDGWMPLDASHGVMIGWETPRIYRRMEMNV